VRSSEVASPTGEIGWAIEILDVRNSELVKLEPFTKSKTTVLLRSAADMQDELRKHDTCNAAGLVGDSLVSANRIWDTVLGYSVTQVVKRWNDVRLEKWVAPQLDCYPLRSHVSDSRGPYEEVTVTKVEEVQPPDSMFEVPPGYTEASPSEVEALYTSKYPGYRYFGERTARGDYARDRSER
jgi:hypothetical protein